MSLRAILSFGLVTLSIFSLLVACGGATQAASHEDCVDFTVTDADRTCASTADCTWVDELHVCSGDPSCGFQNPVNKTAAARYHAATDGISRTPVNCGAPAPVACVASRCVLGT
jgi:hypothetical protein